MPSTLSPTSVGLAHHFWQPSAGAGGCQARGQGAEKPHTSGVMGFRVSRVLGLVFRVWGLGFGVWGLGYVCLASL